MTRKERLLQKRTLAEIAKAQGWTVETQLKVALDFIALTRGREIDFRVYSEYVAWDENMLSDSEGEKEY